MFACQSYITATMFSMQHHVLICIQYMKIPRTLKKKNTLSYKNVNPRKYFGFIDLLFERTPF